MRAQRLKPIIDKICQRAGLNPTLVDSSLLTEEVQGYTISSATTGKQALTTLMQLFQFYGVESDEKLKFIPVKDSPYAGKIERRHIGALRNDNSDGGGVITIRRESTLPKTVELTFNDPARTYRENVARYTRETAESEIVERISVPLVVPLERATQICQAALNAAWAAQTSIEIQVFADYAYIEPGDTVEFDDALWRVDRVQFSPPLTLKLNLSRFSYAPFRAVMAATTADVVVSRPVEKVQPVPVLLDIQPIDQQIGSGFYFAAYEPKGKRCPQYATLYVDNSDGSSEIAGSVAVGAVVGTLTTGLPAGTATTWDEAGTLELDLLSTGALLSVTAEQAIGGANRALVGGEIIHFAGATLNEATGRYTLTGLVRGAGGSAQGAAVGARFVLLSRSLIGSVSHPVSLTNRPRTYRLVGDGLSRESAAQTTWSNTNLRYRPLPPAHLRSSYVTGVGLTLSWLRQARINYELMDETDVPLDVAAERYEVELLDAAGTTLGSAYTSSAAQLTIARVAGATAFRVRQLGDVLPGVWAVGQL